MLDKLWKVLMDRDGYTMQEALDQIKEAKQEVADGADPEEVLQDMFGLEPDYVFDII